MPEFAERIEITDSGLKINGQDFPWYIAEGGVSLNGGEGMETLTLTLLTGRVAADSADPTEPDTESPAPTDQDSMLDAAKISLKEAERLDAKASEIEARPHYSYAAIAEQVSPIREQERSELLLANAQASIAIAEALTAGAGTEDAPAELEGAKIGTATVEIVPDFSAFDGQGFERAAVRRAVQRVTDAG